MRASPDKIDEREVATICHFVNLLDKKIADIFFFSKKRITRLYLVILRGNTSVVDLAVELNSFNDGNL